MQARVGDRIVIRGHRVGQPLRDGEIGPAHLHRANQKKRKASA
mgnify:CR=1 FL=1